MAVTDPGLWGNTKFGETGYCFYPIGKEVGEIDQCNRLDGFISRVLNAVRQILIFPLRGPFAGGGD